MSGRTKATGSKILAGVWQADCMNGLETRSTIEETCNSHTTQLVEENGQIDNVPSGGSNLDCSRQTLQKVSKLYFIL